MIVDFRDFAAATDNQQYDICIAGSGPAGCTVAMEAAKRGLSVLILEGGGRDVDFESQELYEGQIVGEEYFTLDSCRLRYFGGTSNHWGGWCRPLDEIDFRKREGIPWTGWPIEKADLNPYMAEASRILKIGIWEGPDGRVLEGSHDNLQETLFHVAFHELQTQSFAKIYGKDIEESQNITLVLYASVDDLVLRDGLQGVETIVARYLFDPSQSMHVKADRFVLCLGGMENPRFLLNCTQQIEAGVGNQNDLVGRFFMEHHTQLLGMSFLTPKGAAWHNGLRSGLVGVSSATLSPTANFMQNAGTLNCGLRVYHGFLAADIVQRAKQELKRFLCFSSELRQLIERHGSGIWCPTEIDDINTILIGSSWEQAPNPDSRVKLSDEQDRFGKRRIALDWQFSDIDRRTARESLLELGRFMARNDYGRMRLDDWVARQDVPIPNLSDDADVGGFHHMGTTRMADSPTRGVVDRNCKVFGLDNLYIGGSSIFATVGHANPTYTIVQLAVRLADHLAKS